MRLLTAMIGVFSALVVFSFQAYARPSTDRRPPSDSSPIPVWIDTDPSVGIKNRDVDDGLALVQAFHSPEIKIVGVSTVFGNADCADTYRIGREIIRRFGPNGLHVYAGAKDASSLGRETAASGAIVQGLRRERLTILAIGPATNIGTVLLLHPELAERIDRIIAVAGRRPGQRFTTGTRDPKGHRDFNFEKDPAAFRVILESKVPLVLVPFEISSKVWIQSVDLSRMEEGSEAARWLAAPSRRWLEFWHQVFGVDGFNPFDTLAVGYVTRPDLMRCESLPAEIRVLPDDVTEEKMQGAKVSKKPYLLGSNTFTSKRKVTYCFQADQGFKEDLLTRIIRQPWR